MKTCKSGLHQFETKQCGECVKIYRAANRDKIAARVKEYRAANREKIVAREKIHRSANREKIAA